MTPVRIRGVTYRSITDAAKAQGVHERTVYFHLDAGTPDLIGKQMQTKRRPCTIEGVDYPSLRAAARALGVSVEAIRQRANRAEMKKLKEKGRLLEVLRLRALPETGGAMEIERPDTR